MPGIVSLVPSLTELVHWLGAGDWLVGRTRFCTEPAGQLDHVAVVGGTKNPDIDRIVAIQPDLVIANKEENRREDIEALTAAGLEVFLTDPNSVAQAAGMIVAIGGRLGTAAKARQLAAEVRAEMSLPPAGAALRVFVPIWKTPLMGLGSGTFGSDLLRVAGGTNVLGAFKRYPEVTLGRIEELGPDLILLPDEPYHFTAADLPAFSAVASARLIDGKILWWYGPRLPASIRALRQILQEGDR